MFVPAGSRTGAVDSNANLGERHPGVAGSLGGDVALRAPDIYAAPTFAGEREGDGAPR